MVVTIEKDGKVKSVLSENMAYYKFLGWKESNQPAKVEEKPVVKKGKKRTFFEEEQPIVEEE